MKWKVSSKVKVRFILLHTMKGCGGSGRDLALHILNLVTVLEWVTNFTQGARVPWSQLNRRLVGPQSLSEYSGEKINLSVLLGIGPWLLGYPAHSIFFILTALLQDAIKFLLLNFQKFKYDNPKNAVQLKVNVNLYLCSIEICTINNSQWGVVQLPAVFISTQVGGC
jgi:hypothetical protein